MRILITGGNGFIGKNLRKLLEKEGGHDIFVLDKMRLCAPRYFRGDICDWPSLDQTFRKSQPEVVVHLAAMVSRRESEETPTLAIRTNAEGTLNICLFCLKYGARLLYAGSSEEYGSAFYQQEVNEKTPLGEPTSIYSMTKRMAEESVQYYAYSKGLIATTIRFFMLYGEGEEPSPYRSAIARFSYSAVQNQPLVAHQDTERSWCHIRDAVEAVKLILMYKQPVPHEVFNIGRHEPISSIRLAETIVSVAKSASEIKKIPPDPTIIPIKRASFKKAKEILGWEPKTSLKEGLFEVIEWMRNYAAQGTKELV